MKTFWDKVNKTISCWEWQGGKDRDGYGHIRIEGKLWQAHRFSSLLDGKDPKGYVVMHTCDNPGCVNPAHLSLGTQKDNIKDMIQKGRYVKPVGRLTDDEVRAIRNSDESLQKLKAKYNLSTTTLWKVKKRTYYKDVL